MNLQSIRENFNRGKMKIDEIKWLIDTAEKSQQEYATLSESIGEADVMICQLQEENKLLKLHETLLLERVKRAESKTRFHKYMELEELVLSLSQENNRYKQMLMIDTGASVTQA